jgi:endogenous inhibitor of DNA gyrase (YacG/DUF329 family)
MNQQDLVMCPKCGYLWHLAADDQFRFVLFGKTNMTCPKCYKHVDAVSQTAMNCRCIPAR